MKLTLTKQDTKLQIKGDTPMTLEDQLDILLNAVLHSVLAVLNQVPEEQKPEAKETLFDLMNIGFSNILHNFAPEFEIHPELDPTAIMKAEDKLIAGLAKDHQ